MVDSRWRGAIGSALRKRALTNRRTRRWRPDCGVRLLGFPPLSAHTTVRNAPSRSPNRWATRKGRLGRSQVLRIVSIKWAALKRPVT